MRAPLVLCVAVALVGCASKPYRTTPSSRFVGSLDVRWVKNDYFLFVPNKENPLALVRPDGTKILPGRMYTDGGSIPRFLWGVPGYSPWGYAPAYIIHDWLFEARHCGYEPDNKYTFEDSVSIMAEGLKAIMEESKEVRDYFVFDSVVAAVGSSISRRIWDKGSCDELDSPFKFKGVPESALPGELLMTIHFK